MHVNKTAKGLLPILLIILLLLVDSVVHGYVGKNISSYKNFGSLYARANSYGVYLRYPGSLNFYNIYPSGMYEIDEDNRKIRNLAPASKPSNENKFEFLAGIKAVLSYFNILNPEEKGIKFTTKGNKGVFYFENIENRDNVLVSIEFNKTDLIVDNNFQVLNVEDDKKLQDINMYLNATYDVNLIKSPNSVERGDIFERDAVYIINLEDSVVIALRNIPKHQIIRKVGTTKHLIEIDLLGGNNLEIETFDSLKDIKP